MKACITNRFESAITAAVEAAREVSLHQTWNSTYCERTPRNYGCSQERHPLMAALAIAKDLATLDNGVKGIKERAEKSISETPKGAWIIAYRPGCLARSRAYESRMGARRVANYLKAKAYRRGEYISAIEKQRDEELAKHNTAISAYCEAGRILADECGVLPKGSLWRPWERSNVVTPQLDARRAKIARAIDAWKKAHGDENIFVKNGHGLILSDAAKALPRECTAGSFVFTPGWWSAPLRVTVSMAADALRSNA